MRIIRNIASYLWPWLFTPVVEAELLGRVWQAGNRWNAMRVNGRKVTAHESEAAATRWLAGRKATH